MQSVTLKASPREETGKNAARRSRATEFIPAVYYRGQETPVHLQVGKKDFQLTQRDHLRVVNLEMDGTTYENCLVREVQKHPLTGEVVHVDFQGLEPGKQIRVKLPIKFKGSPAGLRQGGQIRRLLHKATIAVLPENLPQFIEIEVAHMNAATTLLVRDLPATDKYKLLVPDHVAVIQVTKPRAAKD
ncbi:MAG: 50S ribosomal protein L25 [Candidatus Cloacimonetes bacterium]|nr:50S ribosomal protein L25 [Candidatus Cloacimonadota bacterium]